MAGNPDAKDSLALTRLMYLFGIGNGGEPCRSREKLREVSKVTDITLRRHIEIWDGEAETLAKNANELQLGFGLREDFLAKHAEDVDFLRRTTDSLQAEADALPEMESKLETLLEGIRENLMLTSEDFAKVLRLLDSYFRLTANRQKVIGLHLAVQKRWQDSSNVSAALSAAEVTMKENAKRKARQAMEDADRRAPASVDAGAAAAANTGLFRRSST